MLQKIKAILCAFVFLTCATAEAADYSREIDQIEGWINATPGADEQARLKMKLKVFLLEEVLRIKARLKEEWKTKHDTAVKLVRRNFKKHCLAHFVGGPQDRVVQTGAPGERMDYGAINENSEAISQNTLNKSHFKTVGFTAVVRDFINQNAFAEVENIYGEKYIVHKNAEDGAKTNVRQCKEKFESKYHKQPSRGQLGTVSQWEKGGLGEIIQFNQAQTTGHNIPQVEARWDGAVRPDVTIVVEKTQEGGKVKDVIFLFNAKQCAESTNYEKNFRGGTFFPMTKS